MPRNDWLVPARIVPATALEVDVPIARIKEFTPLAAEAADGGTAFMIRAGTDTTRASSRRTAG
ncbi:hypothetical protein N5079_19290 [Planotetraspora sp. A-T 1434]|uniref:hypothetical protein n=1 Tax=Planotetraspora sp. A-T 1434 TaxID=2979219 RepID=UPI0021BE0511|nr:hypothetical protein [Planotetraspora sp. A-T 1434]MCT9932351.1 hypothetical protein [Planotetraspora sp. A-T 1434]